MGVPETIGAARPELFTALAAAADVTPGEVGLYAGCLAAVCGIGFVSLYSFSEWVPGDPSRRTVAAIAAFVVPAALAFFSATALVVPSRVSEREARVAAICADIISDVEGGRVAEITTSVQWTVQRECGTEALVAAANAPAARLRLH